MTSDVIVSAARSWIGTPYRHQASLKHVGCDCLGLVRGVWRDVYGDEPELPPAYSADWAEASSVEAMAEAARRHCLECPYTEFKTGDLLLFRWRDHLPAKHAGIATGPNTMVHAQDGVAVTEIDLSPWWLRRLAFVFRFPDLASKNPHPPCGHLLPREEAREKATSFVFSLLRLRKWEKVPDRADEGLLAACDNPPEKET